MHRRLAPLPLPTHRALTPSLALALALALLTVRAASAAPVAVTVDPSLDRHAINPLVYGVNFGDAQEFGDLPYPSRRWGGNSTTRYSWTLDTHNTGADWFYMNIPSSIADPGTLPDGSSADLFIDETRAAGSEVVLTVPLIGWVPKTRAKSWGFSVARYGAQTSTECTASGGAFWCMADAGGGVRSSDGQPITGNDPHDTSVEVGPDFVAGWRAHLAARYGTAAAGGVRYLALDNEPALWNSTHRDVHPLPLTYDELWQRTLDHAGRLKQDDPALRVMGPVSWGWCEYFHSAADGCTPGADQAAHGGLPLIEWYLAQNAAHQAATGTRLVDVLDIHYYPQDGSALNDDESATLAARRLRELKSLYDPAYVDESWIGQPVNLIPRMKSLIAARCPGMGLAITEYNLGGDTGISSAIAQAEALAIFGREGVELATRWVAPAHGSRVQDAFRLYLDYDGAGTRVDGTSVRATTSSADRVGAYAVDDGPHGRLFVLLFNKSTVAETAHLTVADGVGSTIALHRFTAGTALAPAGSATLTSGAVDLTLPARSATLAVVSRPVTAVPPTAGGAGVRLRGYPNPFRAATALAFELPAAGPARLAVYDASGRRVRTLLDGESSAGPHEVAWDGTDDAGRTVPPGVFVSRLVAGDRVESRWLVRLR
jgi:hypothetical protein